MIEPRVDARLVRRGDRDPPRAEQAAPLRRHEAPPRLRCRHRPVAVPDAARQATRSSSSGATRGGIRRPPTGRRTRSRSRPGPGNPLGTRWMGLSAPAVGIHGTPDPASIGYSVSHGCIRMRIPEVEWLFDAGRHRHAGLHPPMTRRGCASARPGRRRGGRRGAARAARLEARAGRERGHVGAQARRHAAAPAWTLERLNGEGDLSFASLRGKTVVLNFWASWCGPCRDEMPLLQQGSKRWQGKNVVFVGIDAKDVRGDARKFLARYGVTYRNVVRRQGLDDRALRRHRLPRDVLHRHDGQGSLPHRRAGPGSRPTSTTGSSARSPRREASRSSRCWRLRSRARPPRAR